MISCVMQGQDNPMLHYNIDKDIVNYSTLDGYLSSNIVTAIEQDHNGMLWFGTKRGLNSYDSHTFEEYNQLHGIINATITSIRAVGDTLFVGTERGLTIYDNKNKKATSYFADVDSPVLPDNFIHNISEVINNKITICTKGGTAVYDLMKKQFYIPRISNYMPDYEVYDVVYTSYDDSWWIATSNGLVNYKDDNNSLKHFYSINNNNKTLPDNELRCFYKINEEMIFIGTARGLCLLDVKDNTIERIDFNKLTDYRSTKIDVSKIISISDSEILISTYTDGLYIYNFKKKTASHVSKFDRRNAISDNCIYDIFKDSYGSIWVATFTGLNRFENNLAKFSTVSIFENGSMLSITYFLELADDNILVGTESGIKVFNVNDGSIKDFKTFFNSKEDYFESLYVYSFYLDKDSCLWVGTRNDGLYVYNIRNDEFVNVAEYYGISRMNHAVVREMTYDEFDNLWIATNMGLCRINLKTRRSFFYNHEKGDDVFRKIPNDDIYDLMLADSSIYVTTGDGLAIYHYETDDFTTYRLPDSLNKNAVVKNNGLFDIVEGRDGRYYIGSYSNGMLAFYPDTKNFVNAKREDVMAKMIYSIIPDDNNFLWASSSKGIIKYSLDTKQVALYDANDGLQGSEFIPNAFLRTKNGMIFFGGFNGFNYFYPEEIGLETIKPKVIVTSVRTSNQHIRYLTDGDTINLSYHDNTIEIGFSTLNLSRKSMIQYSCFLENYDTEWSNYDSKHRYADYNNLRPGTYVFKLKAANEVGIWTEKPLELTIIIHPAWYQRTSFKITVFILVLLSIATIIRQRSKIVIQKREQRKMIMELETQMNQLKQKTLQLQMNPHVIFNTLNSIQQFVINNDIDNAVRYLSSFSKLMRRILNNSNERYIPLNDELEAIRLYLELEAMRLGNRFSYTIIVDPDIDAENIEIAPLIIQPFVENAIIHGLVPKKQDCFLSVTISKSAQNKLLCVIEDNGVGRKYSESMKEMRGAHKSYGMSITRRRLEMMSKISNDDFSVEIIDLYNDAGESRGTRVNIILSYYI